MPRIKRWFPVSHDINSDPEIWAMRREIGEKSLSIWLEMLSISDRNESELPGDCQELIRSIAGKCQATIRTVTAVLDFAISRLWLTYHPTLRTTKYWNYHKKREPNKAPIGEPTGSPPTLPSLTTLPNLPKKKDNTSHPKTDEWPSPTALFKLYNDLTPGEWSAIETISPARKEKALKYLKMFPKKEFWEEVFAEIHKSQWLRGLSHSNGREAFRNRNLDWLMSKGKGDQVENCVKVNEGRYRQ